MKMINRVKIKLAAALGLAVLAIVVIAQNVEPVTVQLLFVAVTMPRAALLAIALLVGVVIGILIALGSASRRAGKIDILEFNKSSR
ncbi:MAG: lipopolysaccharide assembly protein LapA domain-containing protein [Desulfurivibrio sp.]|nr:lipopolysaccharide assembly protein LapA domain-containing protein [Desulfurivibrio sp.]